MNKIYCFVIAACLAISGCADTNPEMITSSVDPSSTISFKSTNTNARVYIDNNLVGVIGDFMTGQDVLVVLPGSHKIEIRDTNDNLLFTQTIFLSNGVNKVINVH